MGLLVQKAEDRLQEIIKRQNEYQQKLILLEQHTIETIDVSKLNSEASKDVFSAAYWLNKKYQVLIFGSIFILLIIILIFIFK